MDTNGKAARYLADNILSLRKTKSLSQDQLARLAEIYSQQCRADESSPVVRVTTDLGDVTGVDDGVVIVATAGEAANPVVADSIEVFSNLGRGVDWSAALRDASIGDEPDSSWHPMVRVGGRTVLAERASPRRQVLVNFWSPTFVRDADFVVLFASILDSFSGGEPRWTSEAVFVPPAPWQLVTVAIEGYEPSPGVYRDETGRLHALNAIDVRLPTVESSDWQSRLAAIPLTAAGGHDVSPWMIVAALVLSLVGLLAFRLTPPAQR